MHSVKTSLTFLWFVQQADAKENFSAIWVFTPNRGTKGTFEVFHEFDVVPEGPVNDISSIHLSIPEVGYAKAVFSQDLELDVDGDPDD